jgi:hypothetical protein
MSPKNKSFVQFNKDYWTFQISTKTLINFTIWSFIFILIATIFISVLQNILQRRPLDVCSVKLSPMSRSNPQRIRYIAVTSGHYCTELGETRSGRGSKFETVLIEIDDSKIKSTLLALSFSPQRVIWKSENVLEICAEQDLTTYKNQWGLIKIDSNEDLLTCKK